MVETAGNPSRVVLAGRILCQCIRALYCLVEEHLQQVALVILHGGRLQLLVQVVSQYRQGLFTPNRPKNIQGNDIAGAFPY